jgi:hypothetical protein
VIAANEAETFDVPSWSDPELGSFCAEKTECVGHYSFEVKRLAVDFDWLHSALFDDRLA